MKKRFCYAFMLLAILLTLFACSSTKKEDTTSLSGSYDIEQFLDLLAPMFSVEESVPTYATEEERTEFIATERQNALRSIGFKGGEEIILNGRLRVASVSRKNNISYLWITDKDETEIVMINGTAEIGWASLLEDNTNIKVRFSVSENPDDKSLAFNNAEILSPSSLKYKLNCSFSQTKKRVTAFGKIVDVIPITEAKAELEQTAITEALDDPVWDIDLKYATHLLTIEDDNKNRIAVLIRDADNSVFNTGDLIGCKGTVLEMNTKTYGNSFMDAGINFYFLSPQQ